VAGDRRLTPRGQERRRQLIEHATSLFATKGYHPTSVVEILREAQRDMRRRQQRAIDDIDDPVERIARGVRAGVLWSAEHRDLFRLFEFAQTDETFGPALRAGRTVLVRDAAAHLKDAIAEGRIPDRDPELLAHSILGVSSLLTWEYVHHRNEPAEEIADAVVAFCLGGIGAGT
jgi:AcrR family transcriptional regulator